MTGPSGRAWVRPLAFAQTQRPGAAILLALDSPDCAPVELAGSALDVWRELRDGPSALDDLVLCVAERNRVSAADVDAGVRAFVASLAAADLVEVAEGPEPGDPVTPGL